MKGLTWPFIGIVTTLVMIFGLILPEQFLSIPASRIIKYEEKHDNSQIILISLLSSTENGKSIQQIIGEHLVLGEPDENTLREQILKPRLDKLVTSGCYKLSTSSKTLVGNSRLGCGSEKYEKNAIITLPYNSGILTEELILVIN